MHIELTYEFFAFIAVIILVLIAVISWGVNNTSLPPNDVFTNE